MKLLSVLGLSRKATVGVLVGVLAVGIAVGALASQDTLPGQSQDPPSAQAVDDSQGDNGDEDNNDNEAGQREVVGIPEDNPNHQPDDGDECEKGETAIKTTPSGNEVNVPCHAVEPGPPSFSHGHEGDNGDEDNNDNEAGQREVVGIPEDNPNHQPDDGDGCEKGETAIKTTPSGNEVNVPCHAVEPGPPIFSSSHNGDEGDED